MSESTTASTAGKRNRRGGFRIGWPDGRDVHDFFITTNFFSQPTGGPTFNEAVESARRCRHFSLSHDTFITEPWEIRRELIAWLVSSFFDIAHEAPPDTRRCSIRTPLNEDVVRRCIEMAMLSPLHYDALRAVASHLLKHRLLTGALADGAARALEPPLVPVGKKGGAPPHRRALRDMAIVCTIERLEAGGMTATRNEASEHRSACDAVAKAIDMEYSGVLAVWKKRPPPSRR